ncbi:MAG: DUF3108 domain-containing protein [Bdellovibrionaceae bacterium]|nr:DUF3108 domain-containing protein [Pseudobdellovibrionaceae bacterium]NUM59484.1 DUF3108 domain-containing protein [Pseudobdellovibrionaceae bacterium]
MHLFFLVLLFQCMLLSGCSSSFLKLDKKSEEFSKNKEFDDKVVIKEISQESGANEQTSIPIDSKQSTKNNKELIIKGKKSKSSSIKDKELSKNKVVFTVKDKKFKNSKAIKESKESSAAEKDMSNSGIINNTETRGSREPEIEDSEGFNGRRPINDPFRVGEEIVHDVHYFKVSAGELYLKVEPFVEVNGRKSYTFTTSIKSSSMFSTFYSADDKATTYVDFLDLVPHVFTLSVKESGQLRDAKGLIDLQKNMATYWEKKFTKKSGEEEKKLEWEVLPFSQNVYSAAYYMRLFKWDVGKEYAFRVADQGENLVFRGKAIRKERLETEIGDFDTIVIKPEITVKGVFRPIGDIYFWLSDDDRKFILRIESSIKIGTIVSEVIRLNKGK